MPGLIELFTMANNVSISIVDVARLAGTLANGGINPETNQRVFQDSQCVKNALSHLLSCGLNTYSGEWAFNVGLPAMCSLNGILMLIVPNICGVAVYSPPVDRHLVSIKAKEFISRFV